MTQLRLRQSTSFALAAALLCAATATLTPNTALAGAEEDAQALYDDAMDNDYLNVKFDEAIGKLKDAVSKCGTRCSKPFRAKLHVALAVIYGAGKNDMKTAKAELANAFKLDKAVKPLSDYFTDDLKKLFEAAKAGAGSDESEASDGGRGDDSDGGKAAGDGDDTKSEPPKKRRRRDDDDEETDASNSAVDWAPPSEALAHTPLPIFIPVEDGVGAESAKLRYKPRGESKWQSVAMKKLDGGFGVVLPCAQLSTTGPLKLYIFLKDTEGEPVAQAGSLKSPLEVNIKNKIRGEQPSLPGEAPPEKCSTVECPPDFPGCGSTTASSDGSGRGDKGWGASCDKTQECKVGYACVNGSCEQSDEPASGEGDGDGDGEGGDFGDGGSKSKGAVPLSNHLVTAGLQIDALFLSSTADVCGAVDASGALTTFENYACFNPDGSGEFLGKPIPGRFNEIKGGAALGDVRLLFGYDLNLGLLSEAARGLAIGARFGLAFGGSPSVGDAADRFFACTTTHPDSDLSTPDVYDGFCRQNSANEFMPIHAEVQLKWFPMEKLSPPKSLYSPRPYVFTGFGVAQVNAGVPVDVCDTVDNNGNAVDPANVTQEDAARCGTNPRAVKREGIESYQITGLNFIPLGVGAIIPVHPHVGINLELKTMFMVPTSGVVLAPFIGPVGMF